MLYGPCSWISLSICALLTKAFFTVDWKEALVLGACITPTDPILSTAIIKGNT